MYNKPLTRRHPLYNRHFLLVPMVSVLEGLHCIYPSASGAVPPRPLAVVFPLAKHPVLNPARGSTIDK